MSSFKFVPFSKKQAQVMSWWVDGSPVKDCDGIICDGAIRSGKTVCMFTSFVIWAMKNFDGQSFILAGKTVGSFRRNVLNPMKEMLPPNGYKIRDHRAENYLTITWNGRENEFYMFGGKDEASQDLVQGLTAAGCAFDEVALMPESFVNQATARCSVDGSKFWFNCNPSGPNHWFKKHWLDMADEKHLCHLHFTMDDNNALSDEIKERYRRQYTGVFYKRYIDGLWVMAEGVIYDMFDPERHVVSELPEMVDIHYVSCDYGTQNAATFLHMQKGKDNKWYAVDEYYYSGRDESKQKTDADYVKDMLEFTKGYNVRAVVVDPSAASFIAALREVGYPVIKAKNDVLDGIRFVGSCFTNEDIAIHQSCQNLIRELGSYAWDEKAVERGEDKPLKIDDHMVDNLRYHLYTVAHKSTARIKDKHREGFH